MEGASQSREAGERRLEAHQEILDRRRRFNGTEDRRCRLTIAFDLLYFQFEGSMTVTAVASNLYFRISGYCR
jgi:hypothetical protein